MLTAEPLPSVTLGEVGLLGISGAAVEGLLPKQNCMLGCHCKPLVAIMPVDEDSTSLETDSKDFTPPTRTCHASVTFRASPGNSLDGFRWSESSNIYFTYPYKVRFVGFFFLA